MLVPAFVSVRVQIPAKELLPQLGVAGLTRANPEFVEEVALALAIRHAVGSRDDPNLAALVSRGGDDSLPKLAGVLLARSLIEDDESCCPSVAGALSGCHACDGRYSPVLRLELDASGGANLATWLDDLDKALEALRGGEPHIPDAADDLRRVIFFKGVDEYVRAWAKKSRPKSETSPHPRYPELTPLEGDRLLVGKNPVEILTLPAPLVPTIVKAETITLLLCQESEPEDVSRTRVNTLNMVQKESGISTSGTKTTNPLDLLRYGSTPKLGVVSEPH